MLDRIDTYLFARERVHVSWIEKRNVEYEDGLGRRESSDDRAKGKDPGRVGLERTNEGALLPFQVEFTKLGSDMDSGLR